MFSFAHVMFLLAEGTTRSLFQHLFKNCQKYIYQFMDFRHNYKRAGGLKMDFRVDDIRHVTSWPLCYRCADSSDKSVVFIVENLRGTDFERKFGYASFSCQIPLLKPENTRGPLPDVNFYNDRQCISVNRSP
jgi:hypothetical protein